ncbi:MAG: Kae1-associated kinase Bud32 [Methanobacteriota archaeon]|nr:MAG: Kae1-associated kinase Bud32 [Euryarchaeota archaeon]|tara:strand:- start:57 stop:746 length:690 start_codon:yes stop_codon:yes gene_type:complete
MRGSNLQVWIEGNKLHEGAEAIVFEGFWLGKPAIKKFRRVRKWRHPELDQRLTKSRLSAEVRTLLKLQNLGFPCPPVYHINLKDGTMFMGKIEGITMVKLLQSNISTHDSDKLFSKLGKILRRLHLCGITHGDLTTTNIIISDSKIILIDFGLSQSTYEVEAFGLDFHVLHECLQATHPSFPDAMKKIIQSYLSSDEKQFKEFEGGVVPLSKDVVARFEQIKGRVRYHD